MSLTRLMFPVPTRYKTVLKTLLPGAVFCAIVLSFTHVKLFSVHIIDCLLIIFVNT